MEHDLWRKTKKLVPMNPPKSGKFKNTIDWERRAETCCYNARRLAEACSVSLRHLQRHFQKQFGIELQKWLYELRLAKAYELLLRSQTVKEVAFKLAFKRLSHFSAQFKKFHGISPSVLVKKNWHQLERPKEFLDLG